MIAPKLLSSSVVVVALVAVIAGMTYNPSEPASEPAEAVGAFGLVHYPVGSADLVANGSELLVTPGNPLSLSGIRTVPGAAAAVNLEFEPIHLEVGGVLRASLQGGTYGSLAEVIHEQTESGTVMSLSLDGIQELLAEPVVTVSTVKDGVTTASFDIAAASMTRIGTVTTDDDDDEDWTKTYHYVCDPYGCILVVDPDNTSIEFVDTPGESVPFQYLAFDFRFREGVDAQNLVSALEIAGVLMDPILIKSGNTVPLSFD